MTTLRIPSHSVTVNAPGFLKSDGSGQPAIIQIDLAQFHKGVGIICTLVGTGLYEVDVTGDPRNLPFVNWNKHDLLNNLNASANGNLAYPVTAVRLNVTSITGSVTMSVVQAIGTS